MNKILLTLTAALFCALAAQAQTKSDTLVVTPTPQMHCQNCENKIKQNVRFVRGTKKIVTSVPQQTVTIVYDGRKTRYEDYVAAFRKIGYEIKKAK